MGHGADKEGKPLTVPAGSLCPSQSRNIAVRTMYHEGELYIQDVKIGVTIWRGGGQGLEVLLAAD